MWYVYAIEHDGTVLYVGSTSNLDRRKVGHRSSHFSARGLFRVVSKHKTEKDARRAERELIREINPHHNKVHRTGPSNGKGLPLSDEDDIAVKIARLRKGDVLVISSLTDLNRNLREALIMLEAIHARGALVQQRGTGLRSDTGLITWLKADLRKMRKGLTSRQAGINGKKGRPRKPRMPDEQAKAFWMDRDILTNAKALTFMPGWSWQMAYRAFGASGRPTNKGAKKRRKR